jgi:hypothetical protein
MADLAKEKLQPKKYQDPGRKPEGCRLIVTIQLPDAQHAAAASDHVHDTKTCTAIGFSCSVSQTPFGDAVSCSVSCLLRTKGLTDHDNHLEWHHQPQASPGPKCILCSTKLIQSHHASGAIVQEANANNVES